MFRLPRGVLDSKTAERYCYTDTASIAETGSHLILSLFVDREPDDYWDGPGGQFAAMVQARAELAAGDLRLLYLAWLLAPQSDEVDDEDTEPQVPTVSRAPERIASGGRRLLRDRRGPHRRGGGFEPFDSGARRNGRVDHVPPGRTEGRAAGAGCDRGRRAGAGAAAAPLPDGQRFTSDGTGPDGRRAVAGRRATARPRGRKPAEQEPAPGRGPHRGGSGCLLRQAPRSARYPYRGGPGRRPWSGSRRTGRGLRPGRSLLRDLQALADRRRIRLRSGSGSSTRAPSTSANPACGPVDEAGLPS